jgi:hypothetical protein
MSRNWNGETHQASKAVLTLIRKFTREAGGPGARNEAQLMVSEKIKAAAEASGKLARGVTANSVVQTYRKKVRSNSRRLSK